MRIKEKSVSHCRTKIAFDCFLPQLMIKKFLKFRTGKKWIITRRCFTFFSSEKFGLKYLLVKKSHILLKVAAGFYQIPGWVDSLEIVFFRKYLFTNITYVYLSPFLRFYHVLVQPFPASHQLVQVSIDPVYGFSRDS